MPPESVDRREKEKERKMVRYRPEAGERGYTFRLNSNNTDGNAVNGVSPTGTMLSDHSTSTLDSSIYKERIDNLFRQLHHQQNRKSRNNIKEEEDDDGDDAVSHPGKVEVADNQEPTMEHLQIHFQKVLTEQRRGPPPAVPTSSKNHSTSTYIHVNNQMNSNNNNIKKEIINSINSENNNPKTRTSFIQARNAVQAQIEKMFQDASMNQQPNGTNKIASSNQQQQQAQVQQQQQQYPHDLNSTVTINNKAVISVRVDPTPKPQEQQANNSSKVHIKQNVPLPPIPKQTASPVVNKLIASPSGSEQPPVTNTNLYKVDYLGSMALAGRATSLESLKFPLKELYSKYRQSINANSSNMSYRGSMEISPAGLRIQYYSHLTVAAANQRRSLPQEILNPFPTIAVWAAVKFVARGENHSTGRKFAFMPLICDPENQDKQSLFHPLSATDDGEWVTCPAFHPPLFTCVMRNTAAPKSLECHAFVCDNPEDAIVIAANLYQALLRNMKNSEQQTAATTATSAPISKTTANTTTAVSSSSTNNPTSNKSIPIQNQQQQQQQPIYSPSTSMSNWSESSAQSSRQQQQQQPVRPPRRKKSSKNGDGMGMTSGASGGLEKRKSIRRSHSKTRSSMGKANLRRSMRSASQRSTGRVKRSVSERQLGEMLSAEMIDGPSMENGGDILTKVAIPRSKSFMTVPQQNYSFAELFEELKVK